MITEETPAPVDITTISTDFHQVGIIAAELILSNSKEHIEVPFKLTLRQSL